jgi:hypothetical protein
VDALRDIALVERGLPSPHPLALDAEIGILVAELVKEAKNDVDASHHFGIVVSQVPQLKLPCDFQVRQAQWSWS